jgi:hypothetical protein
MHSVQVSVGRILGVPRLQPKLGAVPALPLGGVQGAVCSTEDGVPALSRLGFDKASAEGMGLSDLTVLKLSLRASLPNLFNDTGSIDEARVIVSRGVV